MRHYYLTFASVTAVGLLAVALAACGSPAANSSSNVPAAASQSAATAGFAGYKLR